MAMILAGAALLSHAEDEATQTAGRAIREACLEAVADGVGRPISAATPARAPSPTR